MIRDLVSLMLLVVSGVGALRQSDTKEASGNTLIRPI